MAGEPPEQLDWLKEEDKKQDEDERARLKAIYGDGAENAPFTEKERKEIQRKKRAQVAADFKKLRDKLKDSWFGVKRKPG